MKTLVSFFVGIIMMSCAPIFVSTDFEKNTNFAGYKTYNYYADMETGLNALDTKRLLNELDVQMAKQGFTLAENPSFFIDIKSDAYQGINQNNVGVGLGGGNGHFGGGISIGLPIGQANTNTKITVEFVDETKK